MAPDLLFSVVIPSYNRADFIEKTIHSILEQTYFHFEVIVIDDGSTDDTVSVVRPLLADTRIRYYRIPNSERGAARNVGTRHSRGDYVTFLDSDDLLLPWHLQTASDKVAAFNSPPVFHLGYEILHSNGRINFLPPLPSPVNQKLLEGNFLSCMGVFLRRDVALENSFDEDRQLSGSEDYELWMRDAARYPILTFPRVTSRLINHSDRSVVTTSAKKLIDRIHVLEEKLHRDPVFMNVFGNSLRKFDSYRTLYLALHLTLSGERWLAFKSLLATAMKYPAVMLNYRFSVALKKIVFR
jgi:glycosyltransferase involved in cell wall biosynthesis